jgi:hypothetical protein
LGRKLRAARGVASVMSTPVTVPGPSFIFAGAFAQVGLPLPPGRWELSVQYISSFNFRVGAQGHTWSMPAYLGRQGPFFAVGPVTGQGTKAPVIVAFSVDKPSFLTGIFDDLFTVVPTIAATRIPDSRRIVPLGRACGQYVDWYRVA